MVLFSVYSKPNAVQVVTTCIECFTIIVPLIPNSYNVSICSQYIVLITVNHAKDTFSSAASADR